jgi:Tol biopolymer transport system component
MTVPAGTRLGPYEILSPLGAGGMGEVYRARDTRLGRDVAVKVLPSDFAADAERRRRFEQEARAASALNHPNIVSIYDIGTDNGVSYIAMELIGGASLRELADSGGVSPRRVLEIAAPLAEGLARAHAAGIVHRDLKPENVMISKDGFVKILDFGLAKATATAKDGGSQMPTMDPGTGAGTVLGTVAYMSPEQAAGRPVDHRSDQFSFATIVYELLSGKRPFAKPTAVETMSAILREDPPTLTQSGVSCPAPLRWIIDRCHAKEPDARYASTLDLARELASLHDHYSELSSMSGGMAPAVEPARSKRIGARQIAALAAALLLGAGAARLLRRPAAAAPLLLRYLTYAGQDSAPAVSPDGRLLAFSSLRSGKPRIWLEELANGTETALTAGPDGDPRFSPDGSSVIFTHMEQGLGSIYRISVLGGEPRRIVDRATRADWSPDGRRIAFVRVPNPGAIGGTIVVSDGDGGREKTLAAFRDKFLDYPRWSPDGKTLAAARIGSIAPTFEAVLLIDPESGRTKALAAATAESSIYGLVWGSPDSLLYETTMGAAAPGTANGTSTLWEQAVRGGPPRRVVSLPTTGSTLDVLRDGNIVLDQVSPRENLRAIPLAGMAAGAPRWLTHGISTDRQPRFSPDGKWVAFSSARNGNIDIWKIALDSGEARRLTEAAGTSWDPAFTPDGKSIVFSSNRSGHFEIWKADTDGSHPVPVTHESADCENPDISADGIWIYFFRFAGKDVGTARIRVDGTGIEFLSSLQGVPELSRDGRFIASTSADGGISIFPTSSPKSEIAHIPRVFAGGSAGGRYRWLGKTHTLLFLGLDDSLRTAIFTQDVDAPISPRPFTGLPSDTAVETFDISPDGRMLLTAEQELQANIYALENVPGVKKSSGKND